MKRQKGQAIVEFAFVLPLFFLMVFAIIYAGMFFADYVELNSIARTEARKAVTADVADATYTYDDKGRNLLLLGGWYNFGEGTKEVSIGGAAAKVSPIRYKLETQSRYNDETGATEREKVVTIEGKRQTTSALLNAVLPETYMVRYAMYAD